MRPLKIESKGLAKFVPVDYEIVYMKRHTNIFICYLKPYSKIFIMLYDIYIWWGKFRFRHPLYDQVCNAKYRKPLFGNVFDEEAKIPLWMGVILYQAQKRNHKCYYQLFPLNWITKIYLKLRNKELKWL